MSHASPSPERLLAIVTLDPAIGTENTGDLIIAQAVSDVVAEVFPSGFNRSVPTHDRLSPRALELIRESDYALVGGSNILSSTILGDHQWRIQWSDVRHLGRLVLCGVGWRSYQDGPALSTKMLLRLVLHPTLVHSVRDGYSEMRLRQCGLPNVINTGCPTMWRLTPEHTQQIPTRKANRAVITLTHWRRDIAADRAFVALVLRAYDEVCFWPQMAVDLPYLRSLLPAHDLAAVRIVGPALSVFDALLSEPDVDYLGTRLHGGIRALRHRRRSLVLGVDNRALEIAKDTGLPVVARADGDAIRRWIASDAPTEITLPVANIARWKSQFRAQLGESGEQG